MNAHAVNTREAGFSLIEVIMAVLILSIGLLGLAATTGFVIRQTTLSDVTTERAMARQSVVERIRALDMADITAGSATIENFDVTWTITDSDTYYRTVEVVTVGPGLGSSGGGMPMLRSSVADTFTFQKVDMRP